MAPVLHYDPNQPVNTRAASYGARTTWPRGSPEPPRLYLSPGPVLPCHTIHPLPGPPRASVLDLDACECRIFCAPAPAAPTSHLAHRPSDELAITYAPYGIHVRWTATTETLPRLHLSPGPVLPSHTAHPLPGPFRSWVLDLGAREWLIFCGLPANDNAAPGYRPV